MATVLVLVTTADGALDRVSLQALTLANAVAAGGPVHAALVGDASLAGAVGEWGATTVHVADHPALGGSFAPDAIARTVDDLAGAIGADVIVGAGTESGNTVMGRVAARAGLPFAANCVAATPGDPLVVTRQRWGGSLLEESAIRADRVVLSVAPHALTASRPGVARPSRRSRRRSTTRISWSGSWSGSPQRRAASPWPRPRSS